jgi:hypothetical protein
MIWDARVLRGWFITPTAGPPTILWRNGLLYASDPKGRARIADIFMPAVCQDMKIHFTGVAKTGAYTGVLWYEAESFILPGNQ